ncbi:hypothetical protein Psch_03516 [Pelotomaculum schinkii]|uniref:Uncharacterized protein n=1 Tax=Pelotomaculum schinkii TaxID=78350 RepID=A0A4Y7R727_9FIRM|nr:hypothetical protein [Pelotomaculum schinkii]TEB04754.1 hypothetical protein Psch_03516 [Pelotomaculum schinkii]
MIRLFVKMSFRDSDFRKSAAYFMVAAILKTIGHIFAAVRETGVKLFDPVLNQARRWRWKNPWLNFLSALVEFLIATLMLPLESIYLLGFLLEKADEKLRAAGNVYIDRWVARYKVRKNGTVTSC